MLLAHGWDENRTPADLAYELVRAADAVDEVIGSPLWLKVSCYPHACMRNIP